MSSKSLMESRNRNPWLRRAIDIGLLLLVLGGVSHWQTRSMLDTDGSQKVPQIKVVSLNGELSELGGAGKRTLLYFWAPWCKVCAVSMGKLGSLQHSELNVVTVAMDYGDVSAVQTFIEQHKVTHPVLLGNEQVRHLFQIKGYPSYYLLDENGFIVGRSFGLSSGIGIKVKNWLAGL